MLASSSVNSKCLALRRGSSDRYARGWNGSSGSFSKKLQTVGLNTKRGQTLLKPWTKKYLIMNRLGRARKVEINSFRTWTKKVSQYEPLVWTLKNLQILKKWAKNVFQGEPLVWTLNIDKL